MLFTPLDWKKIAPLWILHYSDVCGALASIQMDLLKLTFSKSLNSLAQYSFSSVTKNGARW